MFNFFLSDHRQGTTNAAAKDLCFQTARHLSKKKPHIYTSKHYRFISTETYISTSLGTKESMNHSN